MLPRQGLLRASQRSTSLTVGAQVAKLHAMRTHKMRNCDILDRSCDIGIAAAFSYKLGAAICGDITAAISPKSPHIAVAPALRKPVHKCSPRVLI